MHFLDDSLRPENQEKLIITASPFGSVWQPEDFPGEIPSTVEEQVQKAVDCYNAGATVLHIHARENNGKVSRRISRMNEVLAGLRQAVPDMILQVSGSSAYHPSEGLNVQTGALQDDIREKLVKITPKPDQISIVVDTTQFNVIEVLTEKDMAGTSFERPENRDAFREFWMPAGPRAVENQLKGLEAAGIQPCFHPLNVPHLETIERLIRRGVYTGPVNLGWFGLGGGCDGPNPYDLINFVQRVPDGATLTVAASMGNTLPINTMAIAMGLHARCGVEDTLWGPRGGYMTSAQQVEQVVRIARELGREIASGKEARRIYKIGEYYGSVEETLARLGLPPNRKPGERGVPLRSPA